MRSTEQAVENIRIGARIRELRKQQNITARQLATWIGCSQPHILNIEAGRDRATAEKRKAIAIALRVTVADLEQAS